jgi:hypothetical protein
MRDAMIEWNLEEKLRKLEALFARPGTEGEKDAAGSAIARIKARLAEFKRKEPEREYRFALRDAWSRMLFLALCRRYGMKPYRYSGQRHTTLMLRVPVSFVEQTLWPEFQELNKTLQTYLRQTTERIIRESVHGDTSEVEVISGLALPNGMEVGE